MISRIFVIVLIFTLQFGLTGAARAQSQDYDVRPQASRLFETALSESFQNRSHSGAYNFNAKGEPGNRYVEWHNDDGGVIYREGSVMATGQWSIKDDMICYTYDNNALGGGCYRVYKLGTCFYFYSSNQIERDDELSRDYWHARSVKKGERATCEDMVA